ncbi:IS4 family transposase [Natrinema sp. CBA1119]|uniref:IS4 family transposase n=1 Tax=Natrinema sp. CBA1119 TaxID=1608465 RepID=UPI000BF44639|nr:IS4 family transposase [Natrinema sp. CBA1119]PGF14201.1 IS4 family transposase [Natrinema sp. CBA1119]PGF17266.1 IS4 family transposase [Natrinema sp. CBA1119]
MTEAVHSQTQRSSRQTRSEEYSQSPTTASKFYSLLDEVDSEFIADQFKIGKYTAKHDFENHLKIGVFEGIHPSDSLAELAEKTATHNQLEEMAASTFSRHTNDRDYRAVVRVLFGLLHSSQLYHQRNVQRKRLERLDRAVVALDGTNLALTRSVTIPSEFDDDEVIDEINPGNWGLKLNLAARVDGHAKQPLGVSVTAGETREPTQFDHLQDDVEVFADLDSPIHVFDRGYLDYDRFCALKEREKDFVCLLQSDSRVDVLEEIQDIDITDEAGTRHVRDELIELAETGETFRRILFEDVDGEEIAYLTTLSSANYDPIDVMNIYTLRTLIEILFRELKQYTNIENFHSQSVNGVLFELFCTLIGYVLIEWFRHCHPLRGGVPEAIRLIRTRWNQSLPVYG